MSVGPFMAEWGYFAQKTLFLYVFSLFTTGPIPVVDLVIVCGQPSIRTHISVSKNFLILGLMMGYDLVIMSIISKC